MKLRFRTLWRCHGSLDRGPYALVGLIGFAVKHNLDRLTASLVFHRQWGIFNYRIPPTESLRHCIFSAGAFLEPIQVWDQPRLLKFLVSSSPPPRQEWTPYAAIHPPHLDGFLVSEQGQFLLTSLGPNRTILEGTTWYRHHMWPADYWELWSDFIIHRIHARVLRHIKRLAEKEPSASQIPKGGTSR